MDPIRQLVVIGAGSAGLMAAITAAGRKIDVLLLEKNSMAGLKILATGNGEGNLSNFNLTIDHYHSQDPEFVQPALNEFGFQKTWDFFEELGLKLFITDMGCVFPNSREASVIQKMLASEVVRLNVGIFLGARIQEILRIGQFFEIKMKQAPSVYAKNIILATGGLAAPQLGATGDGYQWATKLGHHLKPQFPSLIQLTTNLRDSYLLNKIKLANIQMNVFIEERLAASKSGDLFFIPNGISGSTVFDISRIANEALSNKRTVTVQVNFTPNITIEEIKKFLKEKKKNRPDQLLLSLLGGILPEKLSHYILKSMKIEQNIPVGLFPENQMDQLIHEITHFNIPVTGIRSWKYAQVTCGGVCVSEVNSKTMESRMIPHLYFAGEILDVDGDCGGYNLQWAWSSGYLAGKSAVEKINKKRSMSDKY